MKKYYYLMVHYFEPSSVEGELVHFLQYVHAIIESQVEVASGLNLAKLFETEQQALSYALKFGGGNECFEVRHFYKKATISEIITG